MLLLALAAAALAGASTAPASELIDRNAAGTKLEVDRQGRALLTYRARPGLARACVGRRQRPPAGPGKRQVEFKLDYSGGWGTYRSRHGRRSRTRARRDGRSSRGSSSGAERRTARTGRCRAGSACSRTTDSRRRRSRPCGSSASRTGRVTCRRWPSSSTGRTGGSTISSGRSPTSAIRSSASASRATGVPLDTLCAEPLPRHVQLRVRAGLEAREQLPDAEPARELLLRVLPARQPAERQGRTLPRDDHRARRDARRVLGVVGSRHVQPRARPDRERRAASARRRLEALPPQLT